MEGQEYLNKVKHTFSNGIVLAFDDTYDNDGNDDDSKSSNNWHNEVDIGQKSHNLRFKISIAPS